ncbi:DNA-binding response regulator [Romboutsia weinsteinii]|uniref:DNA-binding response regulator n=1 Tax=Romboutsia weinsteinii TaxID=2020949 RepID=A0A371J3V8_9FIRM|nr:response regulator transcription factor [Romboutsia weinsteinii]RDY27459.1 DNA-binding response regulator [Romboutsia weinsteinii]
MNLLIISKSFIVSESIASVFKTEFNIDKIKVISNFNEMPSDELNEYNFVFMETDKDNLIDLENICSYKNVNSELKILILDLGKNQSTFTKATKLGVDGYIINIYNKEDFIYIVKRIMRGKSYYDTEMVESIFNKRGELESIILTGREKEVFNQVVYGLSNKEVANNLHITEYTVKKHISSILHKLNLKSRQEVIIYYKDNYTNV